MRLDIHLQDIHLHLHQDDDQSQVLVILKRLEEKINALGLDQAVVTALADKLRSHNDALQAVVDANSGVQKGK